VEVILKVSWRDPSTCARDYGDFTRSIQLEVLSAKSIAKLSKLLR
jgi:hypothetical protein